MAMRLAIVLVVFVAAADAGRAQQNPPVQAPAPAPTARLNAAEQAVYRIGPEDVLSVTVLEATELNRTVQVTTTGEISLPLIGMLKVSGMTPIEVEAAVAARLKEKYIKNPNVSIQVTETHSHTVSVTGAVRKPGVFQIRSPRALLEVIALAEGLAEDAGETALIVRGDAPAEPVVEVKLKPLMESRDGSGGVIVRPGDTVRVTTQGVVYVVGDVKKPGAFAMRGGTHTVLSVLAQSEGLAPTASPSKAVILRANPTGDREQVAVDVERVLRGKAPDVPLQPEDVLFIPQSGTKVFGRAAADAALRILTLRVPFVR